MVYSLRMLKIGGFIVVKTKELKETNLIPFLPEADFYYAKGIEFYHKRKLFSALKWMKKALEKKPNDPFIQCQLSVVYMEMYSYREAQELLLHVMNTTPDYADCYYLLANSCAHLGLFDEAIKYADLYLEKAPDGDYHQEALQLAKALHMEDDETDEEITLEQIELADEDDLLFLQETVFYFMEYFEWEDALETLEDMLTLFPDYIRGKHDYAQALFFSGEQQEAIELELDLLQEQPYSLSSYANLALFYYERGEEEYKYYVNNLLHVYPMHEEQKLKVAVTLTRTGKHEEAYKRFRSLQKNIVESHPSYYRWYAHASFYYGKKEKARTLWKEGCHRHVRLQSEKYEWNS